MKTATCAHLLIRGGIYLCQNSAHEKTQHTNIGFSNQCKSGVPFIYRLIELLHAIDGQYNNAKM
jgi:hypothetical protein